MASSDVSAVTKFFSLAAEGFTTTTSGTISAAATSVGLNDTTGLTNAAVFVGIIEPGATAQQTFTGTVDISGSQITNVVWTRGTNVGHAGGVTVVDYVSGTGHNMLSAGILKQHTQAGAHTSLSNTGGLTTDTATVTGNETIGGTLAVTGASTLSGAIGGAGYDVKTQANSYKFSVYRNASYSPASGINLILDTKLYDTGTNFSTSTGLFTAPVAGFYQFDGEINFNAGGSALIFAAGLSKNGSELVRGDQITASDSAPHGLGVSRQLQLSANDTVGLWWASSNGGTTTMNVGTGPIVTGLSGYLTSAT